MIYWKCSTCELKTVARSRRLLCSIPSFSPNTPFVFNGNHKSSQITNVILVFCEASPTDIRAPKIRPSERCNDLQVWWSTAGTLRTRRRHASRRQLRQDLVDHFSVQVCNSAITSPSSGCKGSSFCSRRHHN